MFISTSEIYQVPQCKLFNKILLIFVLQTAHLDANFPRKWHFR